MVTPGVKPELIVQKASGNPNFVIYNSKYKTSLQEKCPEYEVTQSLPEKPFLDF